MGAVIAALAIGIGWQVRGKIGVQGVLVSPGLPGLAGVQLPYFGETGSYIYLGVVTRDPDNTKDTFYEHQIEELRRSKRVLTFTGHAFTYCRPNTAPGTLAWNLLVHGGSPPALKQC